MRKQMLTTAGERIAIDCDLPWVDELINEATAGERRDADAERATLAVRVESSSRPFHTTAWEPVTRGAWRRAKEVVLEDVCGSGFDLRLASGAERMDFTYRRRPKLRGPALVPDIIVSLRRSEDSVAVVKPCDPATAARSLITGTFIAGELRRYWSFAATLTAATGLGPAQAPVEEIAEHLAARLPAVEIVLPNRPGLRLSELLNRVEAIA